MSILIKGMNLPKEEVAVIIYSDGEVRTEGWEKYSAVEVPEHGDLIDMQAMFNGEHNLYSWFEIEKQPIVIPADKGGET